MQKLVSIFFLFVFVMVTFQDLTFYSLFKLNQEYLTEKFCINKEKKEMHCKGKCHFSKQVEKSKQEQEKSQSFIERFEVNYLVVELDYCLHCPKEFLKHQCRLLNPLEASYQFKMLRPPQSV